MFNLVVGFNPSEKYESQLGLLFPIYGKKHVPNHQAVNDQRVLWLVFQEAVSCFMLFLQKAWYRLIAGERAVGSIALVARPSPAI